MKKHLFFLLILFANTFLKVAVLHAQNYEEIYHQLENELLLNHSKNVIQKVDSMLLQENMLSKEYVLDFDAQKMEAIVQNGLLLDALKLSNKLLENSNLSERSEVRLRIQRALIFEFFNESASALKEFNRLEEIYETRSKDRYYGQYLYRKSSYYRVAKPIKKSDSVSLLYANRANDFGEKYGYYKVSGTAKMLQSFLVKKENVQEKEKLLQEALLDFKLLKNMRYQSMIYANLAREQSNQNKVQKALKLLDSALNIANINNDMYYQSLIYEKKSKIFETKKQLDSAFFYFKKFHKAEIEMNLEKQNLEIAKENFKNELEKQKTAAEVSKAALKRLRKSNLHLFLFLTGITFLLMIIVLLYRRNISKKKEIDSQNIRLKKSISQKEILLKELNHRVKNNLSLIISLIRFQGNEIKEKFYLEKFNNLENRISAISIAHDQFMYSEDYIEGKFYKLERYLSKISNSLISLSTKKVVYNQEIEEIDVTIDTALPIGVLMNELISNSLKHAKVEEVLKIDVTIKLNKEWITILYSDSGAVFTLNENNKGLGTFIIESMVAQLQGHMNRKDDEYNIQVKRK